MWQITSLRSALNRAAPDVPSVGDEQRDDASLLAMIPQARHQGWPIQICGTPFSMD